MSISLLRTDKEIAEIYKRHSKTVYRVCFAYMKNPADTEDAVQDTFFQLIMFRLTCGMEMETQDLLDSRLALVVGRFSLYWGLANIILL